MNHSFLIVDTYYPKFLDSFYKSKPELGSLDYDGTMKTIVSQAFGTADFYSSNLTALGHSAKDVIANDEILQGKWARENGVPIAAQPWFQGLLRQVPYVRRFTAPADWLSATLEAQIKLRKPDVLFFHNLSLCRPELIESIRKHVGIIVGQIASPLPAEKYLRGCDLILTSFPHYVDRFRKMGIASEYFKLGFETTLLPRLSKMTPAYDCVFVGGISRDHRSGTRLLEKVAGQVRVDFWGYGVEALAPDSPVRKTYHGEAWGLEMYNTLRSSKVVLNRHIDVAENYANNMRLYEATGVGAMLLTDYKENLHELFEIGKEVETYSNQEELVEKAKYYLAHENEREKIALAGQKRTLEDHGFSRRMKELSDIVSKYM